MTMAWSFFLDNSADNGVLPICIPLSETVALLGVLLKFTVWVVPQIMDAQLGKNRVAAINDMNVNLFIWGFILKNAFVLKAKN